MSVFDKRMVGEIVDCSFHTNVTSTVAGKIPAYYQALQSA
jgi:hypothetical protein